MQLKRLYDTTETPPRLIGIKVLRAGPVQRFSVRFLANAIAEGWVRFTGRVISFATTPPLCYRIVKHPGVYCCHCSIQHASLGDARKHSMVHQGTPSPDREHPSGYCQIHYYDCTRVNGDGGGSEHG